MIMKLPIETIITLSDLMGLIESYEGLSDDGAVAIYENTDEYEKLIQKEYVDKLTGFAKKLHTEEYKALEEGAKQYDTIQEEAKKNNTPADITSEMQENYEKFKELEKITQDKFDKYKVTLTSATFDVTLRQITPEDQIVLLKNPYNRKKISSAGFRLIKELFVKKLEEEAEEVVEPAEETTEK